MAKMDRHLMLLFLMDRLVLPILPRILIGMGIWFS